MKPMVTPSSSCRDGSNHVHENLEISMSEMTRVQGQVMTELGYAAYQSMCLDEKSRSVSLSCILSYLIMSF